MPVDDDEPLPHGFALGHDGKIEGIYRPQDQRKPPAHSVVPDGPLELEERPVKVVQPVATPQRPPPRAPPPGRGLGLGMLVAGVVGLALLGAAVLLRGRTAPPPVEPAPEPAATTSSPSAAEGAPAPAAEPAPVVTEGVLTIDSEPSGATVFLGVEDMGRTPYLGSNGFPKGEKVQVRLVLAGYRPWSATFKGGADTRLHARLQRQ